MQNYNSTWIRNIATGQNVTIAGADLCGEVSSCSASPKPICPYAKACSTGPAALQQVKIRSLLA